MNVNKSHVILYQFIRFLFQYCPGGELFDYIVAKERLSVSKMEVLNINHLFCMLVPCRNERHVAFSDRFLPPFTMCTRWVSFTET